MTVSKANLRKQIDKDVKTFLDKGGVIEKVKPRLTKLESVAKFISALSDEEREFISAVRIALIEGMEWKP